MIQKLDLFLSSDMAETGEPILRGLLERASFNHWTSEVLVSDDSVALTDGKGLTNFTPIIRRDHFLCFSQLWKEDYCL
jgi:hypothetical protein